MPRLIALAALLVLLAPVTALAGALEPFVAHYQVFRGGRELGQATLRLMRTDAARWRVDLVMDGKGLIGLAGLRAEQSTVFDAIDGRYVPLSQSTVRRMLFSRRQTVGVYDWARGIARWSGDVKKTRTRPIPLRPGDMSGLLINLAVIRDAAPGATLRYRFVDDGRVREHEYAVAVEPEAVAAGDLEFSALRVDRVRAGGDDTTIWVAQGVPTPIRILQREDGEDSYDLRLIEYTGAP